MVPCVSIHQMSFDIETFSHHIADWICKLYKKKYGHCSDYDIEIVDICALTGDIICLLIMKIETSDQSSQGQWFVLLNIFFYYTSFLHVH